MVEAPARPAPAAHADDPADFVRQVRRRSLWRGALALAVPAALLNEAVRWAAVGGALLLRRKIPVLDVGPIFLLVAGAALWRRWNLPATARFIDMRLAFRDRLTSLLAFSSRGDIPEDVRRAQAAETARALAGVPLAAVAPLRPWLAAGPLLLAASLLYPLFLSTAETTTFRLARRVAPALFTHGGRQSPPPPPDMPAAGDRQARTPAESPAVEKGPLSAKGGVPGAEDPELLKPDDALPGAKTEGGASSAQSEPGSGGGPAKSEPDASQPDQIASQRVGTSLARVVDPVYNPGKSSGSPALTPSGTFSFRLLPKRARKGAGPGEAPGETTVPERVTVNFDAIPEQYRTVVRTYFDLLARSSAGRATDTLNP